MPKKIRLSVAARQHLAHCTAKGNAVGTVRVKTEVLRILEQTVGDLWVDQITGQHIDKLFASRNWAPRSRNSRLSMLRGFFDWSRANGYIAPNADPLFGWRNAKVTNKPRLRIPRDQWDTLFEACMHPQERMALATGLYLFLRGSEQKFIQLKHIDLQRMEIDIFRQKINEWDTMPISEELAVHLREHLTWMSSVGASDPEHYLIPTRNHDFEVVNQRFVVGTGTIDPTRPFWAPHHTVQTILRRCGYPTYQEGEHTLRRSGARAYFDALVEQGYDGALRRVMSMLGHTESKTTEIYLGLDLDRTKRNDDLRGRPMFPARPANVVKIREVR